MTKAFLFPQLDSKTDLQSGISIRIIAVKSYLESQGFDIRTNGPSDFTYSLVSTKRESEFYQLALNKQSSKLVLDLYTPIFLEKLTYLKAWHPWDWLTSQRIKEVVRTMLKLSDYFLVANKRQKDYWYKASKKLGVPMSKAKIYVMPTPAEGKVKALISDKHKKIILWFGGIYPWLDPLPLVDAFSKMSHKYPKWKLRILGGLHPDTGYQKHYLQVIKLARFKIKNNQLEIIPWQSNKNLSKYLKDVAFAVHISKNTPEDYFAHRVRLLTLTNMGIPVITSGRDLISDLIVKHDAGVKANNKNLLEKIELALRSKTEKLAWSKNAYKIQDVYLKSQRDAKNLYIILQ